MFYLYNTLLLMGLMLLAPLWIPWVFFREKYRLSFRQRAYMPPIDTAESVTVQSQNDRIWVHALSVGEVLSAEPLVIALAARHRASRLVFTASTRTGFETACRVIAPHVGAVRFFPYDTPVSVLRAVRVIRPRRVVIVETDIWPVFLTLLSRRRIPVCLVNARLSARSFKGYRRIRFLMQPLLDRFDAICVQTEKDRLRFRRLGVAAEKLARVGNIKFDQAPVLISPPEMRAMHNTFELSPEMPLWIAGSTHPGEEALLADVCRSVAGAGHSAVLIVAPRDPARADDVVDIFRDAGIAAQTLAQIEKGARTAGVIVVDRIGLLRQLYALADVAFVGGSLVAAGGHNPLEAASLAKPVVFGPWTDDFDWICRTLEDRGGAVRVYSSEELAETLCDLLNAPQRADTLGRRAQALFLDQRGAVNRTIERVGI